MPVGIAYGNQRLVLEVAPEKVIEPRRQHPLPRLEDPSAAVRDALEIPDDYPALRRALTPDDHVAVVVDEALPHLTALLTPILKHIVSAGVKPEAITLLCPPSLSRQAWIDELPESFEEVRLEIQDPTDRKKLSYLATTKKGRRIYLNRTAVEADQLILLTGRRFDPVLGISGCESALYPAMSDEPTRMESANHLSPAAPDEAKWPVREEAAEVAWLIGAPFVVQIVEGAGDSIAHVLCGPVSASEKGARLLKAHWLIDVSERADLVIASVSGKTAEVSFAELGAALACAARVVRPDGRIVLLTQAAPALQEGAQFIRKADDSKQVIKLLKEHHPPDMSAAYQWSLAAQQAHIYLLSGLPNEIVEEMFAVPLDDVSQGQRLISPNDKVLFLEDAHKMLARVK
jgi:nickel-dependent lactate racemase